MNESYPITFQNSEDNNIAFDADPSMDPLVYELIQAKRAATEMHSAIVSFYQSELDADSVMQIILNHMDNSVIVSKLDERRVNKLQNMVLNGLSAEERKLRLQNETDSIAEEINITNSKVESINADNKWIETISLVVRSVDSLEREKSQEDLERLLSYGLREVTIILNELRQASDNLKEFDYNYNPDNLPQHQFFARGEDNYVYRKQLLDQLSYCQERKDLIYQPAVNAKKVIDGTNPIITKDQLVSVSNFIDVFMPFRIASTDKKINELNQKIVNLTILLKSKAKELQGIRTVDSQTMQKLKEDFAKSLESVENVLVKLISS